ncbi:MAG TPA: helix-turn-helix transcriptional regulator [Ktedonobacterales bacterium]|jgi:ribosome-binding protein aMBF1 (putative translation factor)
MMYSEEDDEEQDDLEAFIAERAKTDPEFPARVEARVRKRLLIHALAAKREELGISQKELAKRLEMTPAAVARLERGEADPKLSLLTRFAAALGQELELRLKEKAPA